MKKLVALFLTAALCMGLAVPTLAADGYEEITVEYMNAFGTAMMGKVTIDQAKAVTSAGGTIDYYEVPAQVQITVTLYENRSDEYIAALRWFNAEFYPNGVTSAQTDVAYALVSASGGLTEYTSRPAGADYKANQLTPNQAYTFTVQADKAAAVIFDCGANNDLFLMKGIQLRCAGSAAQPEETGRFADVPADTWYTEPVGWAVEKGITDGTSKTTFSPNNTCTTAQIITFLWRAYGSLSLSDENPFTDVDEDAYYADAAVWAARNGLISGDTFGGNTPCTRSATVTYLWKLAGMPSADPADFSDVDADAEYAEAVAWAVANGITDGTGKNTFSPDNTCTRAQIVTFLYRGYGEVIE